MANNLNSSVFQDGTPIFEAKTDEEWRTAGCEKRPAWCYYGNDSSNGIGLVFSEIGYGVVVGLQLAQQPMYFYVTNGFFFKYSAGANTIQIAV